MINNNSNPIAVLIKCDSNFINNVKFLYNNGSISFINRWSVDPTTKPMQISDGTEVYLYVNKTIDNQVDVVATGVFREKIFKPTTGLFACDTNREATVQDAFALYNISNGESNLQNFKTLLQNCANNYTNNSSLPKHSINDDTKIGITIISDLDFFLTPKRYTFNGNTTCSCGFRYITAINNQTMDFK